MKNNRERGGVGRKDHKLGCSTVKGLCGLCELLALSLRSEKKGVRTVSALLDLTVVAGRLDEIEELLGQSLVGDGPGCRFSQLCFMAG